MSTKVRRELLLAGTLGGVIALVLQRLMRYMFPSHVRHEPFLSTPSLNHHGNRSVLTVGASGDLVLLGVSDWNGAIDKLVGEARTYAKNYADGKHGTAMTKIEERFEDGKSYARGQKNAAIAASEPRDPKILKQNHHVELQYWKNGSIVAYPNGTGSRETVKLACRGSHAKQCR